MASDFQNAVLVVVTLVFLRAGSTLKANILTVVLIGYFVGAQADSFIHSFVLITQQKGQTEELAH